MDVHELIKMTSREAWEAWFERLGTVASTDVVNATATLVIAERDIAVREAEDAALERAAEAVRGVTVEAAATSGRPRRSGA